MSAPGHRRRGAAALLRSAAVVALPLALSLAGCLSSRPPAPPVRFFDPLPDGGLASAAEAVRRAPPSRRALRVEAPPHLGREWVLRVGPREFAFDVAHQWTAEPAQLVAAAMQRAGRGDPTRRDGGDIADEIAVEIERFEFDVTGPPQARVRLLVRNGAGQERFDAAAPATSRAAEALAAAMAQALADVVDRVR